MDDLWLALRIANVVLYGGIVSGVLMNWTRMVVPHWPGVRWFLLLFWTSSMYATVDIAFKGLPGGPRLIPLTISLLGLFVGCYLPAFRTWRDGRRERKDANR